MNTEEKQAKMRMQGKPVIPGPGVETPYAEDDAAEYTDTADVSDYSTGVPLSKLAPTGSAGYLWLIGAAALGYYFFVKPRRRRGGRKR